ncbi:hypothetical protein [Nocardia bovistercoris]|uniref:SnoaL-like domain-containing protein n=1 Tax=Nocardia bovistercoris TaxID=2785916 RepID=A0A931N4T6_9NOCA|nr:hypothetical protein [Nocardia bovistercoris]MBH0778611.1 hypothetical protein [Nocardia bovistercoris]
MTTTSPLHTADDLAELWTRLWNGSFELAHRICADEFRVLFAGAAGENGAHPGDTVGSPAVFVDFVRRFRASKPGIEFGVDGPAAGALDVDGAGLFAVRWYAELPDRRRVSGIDMFEAVAGRLTTVWSVTGQRAFPVDSRSAQ